ncbi:MAG: pilus assembly protein PilM, partial [Tepidisphaeraceae bacterium]
VDVGARRTLIVIGRGHDISFIKPIEIGGRQFHEAVARKLNMTPDEARALRRRLTESNTAPDSAAPATDDPVRQAVLDATRSGMEEMARELALCLRYFSVTFRGQRPERVRLYGGEANDPQLQATLGSVLPIPVEVARPLHSVDTSRMRHSDRRGPMSEWAVALGLGLRSTTEHFGARDGKRRQSSRTGAPAPVESAQIAEVVRA